MTPTRDFWRSLRTGEVWAVETQDGRPLRCFGPFTAADADAILLPHLPLSTLDLEMVRADWAFFVRLVRCPVCAGEVRPGAQTVDMPSNGRAHLGCALNPPSPATDSVGAAVRAEPLWQVSARLGATSHALRRASTRLRHRSAELRRPPVAPHARAGTPAR